MRGLTRGTITLIGAGVAGFLVWLATHLVGRSVDTNGDYWAVVGLVAVAGLVLALSQLLGGWTKWGWPRVSQSVFLIAFVPVLIAVGWVLLANQTDGNWLRRHTLSWAHDVGIGGLVGNLGRLWPVLALALGLVFGFVFDTTGPRTEPLVRRRVRSETVSTESAGKPVVRAEEPGAVAADEPPPAVERP